MATEVTSKCRKFKTSNGRHIAYHIVAMSQRKIVQFDKIWYTINADLELHDSYVAKYDLILNLRWRMTAI